MRRLRRSVSFVAIVALVASAAAGQDDADARAGTVAAVVGGFQVVRSAGASPLRVGDPVVVGDRLRTAEGDRAKILLADDSIVDIGAATEVLIETRQVDADGRDETVLILIDGKIRSVAPSEARHPGARFEIETPAAVAFRGTDFYVSHEQRTERSHVVALEGRLSVAGKVGVVGGLVELEEGSGTTVAKGRLPGAPAPVSFEDRAQIRQLTRVFGTGRRDGLDVLHPVTRGQLVSAADLPPSRGRRIGEGLTLGPPGEFLAAELSADVRTNTEPLLEYKRRDPGIPAATGVEVEF